jgi:hypothetical protein
VRAWRQKQKRHSSTGISHRVQLHARLATLQGSIHYGR